jgi:hypothetical protein
MVSFHEQDGEKGKGWKVLDVVSICGTLLN